MSKNAKKTESTFTADTLPAEFESVLGAMILCGWSYSLTHATSDGYKTRIVVRGIAPLVVREAMPRTQEINVTVDHDGDGIWSYDGMTTGLVRTTENKAGLMIDLMPLEKLVDYVGKRINPTMLMEIEPEIAKADEETVDTETVTEEVVDEEVIDESKALA